MGLPVGFLRKHADESGAFVADRRWQRLRARGQILQANTVDLVVRSRTALERSRGLLRHARRMVRESS